LGGITGRQRAEDVLGDIQKEIRLGAGGTPQTLNMTGKRYQLLRSDLQGMIDAEGNTVIKKSLTDTKDALDNAFYNSQPDKGAALKELKQEGRTHKVLAGRNPTLEPEMTPQSVLQAATKAEGAERVNTGKSQLGISSGSISLCVASSSPADHSFWPDGFADGGLTGGTTGYGAGG
jgi:hypothetical protein